MSKNDKDFATGKLVDFSKPEESVRQEYERILHDDLGYAKKQMDIEVPIQMGSDSTKRCDIAIYDNSNKRNIIGIVECKAPKTSGGKEQLKSYMSVTPTCRWGVWTNGDELECATRNIETGEIKLDAALSIPKQGEHEVIIRKYDDLIPTKHLKTVFRMINHALYANANLVRTEKQGAEMVRLIFCKFVDEYEIRKTGKAPAFQVQQGESKKETRQRINELWQKTKTNFMSNSIFSRDEKITIDDYSLRLIISKLQGYSLIKTDRDVVGDAFQIFSDRQFAGEKGQFFTPRAVVKMIIHMINPQKDEKIIDPACGSGGFLVSALNHITSNIKSELEILKISENCLYGIDKDKDLAKICRAYMCLVGDGKSNIVSADSLAEKEWEDKVKGMLLDDGELLKFDVVVTNPPFGTKIKVNNKEVLENYDLGHKWTKQSGKWEKTSDVRETPPQVLFIELCFRLLKPGGRLGIVLPDGLLGNPGDGYIRQWIEERANILAVVDCPTATFMPHTGTKTSVIIMQKHHQKLQKPQNIFFAIAENCGHTMRGKDIYTADETIREDFSGIAENYLSGKKSGHLGFYKKNLVDGILVPRYYDPRILAEIQKIEKHGNAEMVSIGELQEKGILNVGGVSSSASSEEYDLHGKIRFIRTSDISSYELYERTQKMVSLEVYAKHKDKQNLQEGDILFVKDGDDKIGETAILLDTQDCEILVQTHFKKIRPITINPFLLLWLLNTDIVKKQIRQRVFNQSTLSTIGNRIAELRLPMPADKKTAIRLADEVERLVKLRRESIRKLKIMTAS